jgi:hypothetical protein
MGPKLFPALWRPLARLLGALGGLWAKPGGLRWGTDGDRSGQKDEQLLEELLLEGLATPAEELSAEALEQLRRDVREVIARKVRPGMSES